MSSQALELQQLAALWLADSNRHWVTIDGHGLFVFLLGNQLVVLINFLLQLQTVTPGVSRASPASAAIPAAVRTGTAFCTSTSTCTSSPLSRTFVRYSRAKPGLAVTEKSANRACTSASTASGVVCCDDQGSARNQSAIYVGGYTGGAQRTFSSSISRSSTSTMLPISSEAVENIARTPTRGATTPVTATARTVRDRIERIMAAIL